MVFMIIRPKLWIIAAVALAISAVSMIPAALAANVASVRLRGTPPAAEDLAEAGATSTLAPSSSMAMRVVMALRNQSELTQLLAEQQDPSSSEYHQWLTPEEFTARFGPTPEKLAQVSAWLKQQGFNVISADASSRLVRFTGTAAQAATAFQTSFAATPDGRYHANLVSPAVPANLAGLIQSVEGLDNLYGAYMTPQPEVTISGGSKKNAFGPPDMYSFYDESPLLNDSPAIDGNGADCIALPEYSDFDDASVNVFNSAFSAYGLTQLTDGSTLVRVAVDGTSSIVSDGYFEALLDVEYAHTAAPGTPIRVYIIGNDASTVAAGFLDAVQQAVTDDACGSISLSISVCSNNTSDEDALATSADAIYQEAAAQGQTIFAATGDDGAAGVKFNARKGTCVAAKTRTVLETAASQYVTAVGGTESAPTYDSNGIATGHATESVWHETKYGAGGGGKSKVFSKPSYQNGVTPKDKKRDLPDISLLAAVITPGYVVGENLDNGDGPQVYCCGGGTSFAAPYWAGIASLIEQLKGGGLDGRLGALNTDLYSLAESNAAGNGILDVTKGSNGWNGVAGYSAKKGYDQATGWGTPDILLFVQAYTGP